MSAKKIIVTVKELRKIFTDKNNLDDLEKLEKLFLNEKFVAHAGETETHLTYEIEIEENAGITLIKEK